MKKEDKNYQRHTEGDANGLGSFRGCLLVILVYALVFCVIRIVFILWGMPPNS